ncbi:MAG: hypothetical protein LBF93_08720 [Zoogloeaceae bacterium]|jgi:hypothetical protein|nr:hypothetical protein [Zoogloeaceae bacterium]
MNTYDDTNMSAKQILIAWITGFFGAIFKFLAVGACWLFFFYLVGIAQEAYRDMNSAHHLRGLIAALKPLQADIAAQLEAAGDLSPPLTPEKAAELTARIPNLDQSPLSTWAHEPVSWKAVQPDGSIAIFYAPAAVFFLLRPEVAEGKTTWTCHAAATRGNILPNICRAPPPSSTPDVPSAIQPP